MTSFICEVMRLYHNLALIKTFVMGTLSAGNFVVVLLCVDYYCSSGLVLGIMALRLMIKKYGSVCYE